MVSLIGGLKMKEIVLSGGVLYRKDRCSCMYLDSQ